MVLSEKTLEEILSYLDKSVAKLAQDTLKNTEFHMDVQDVEKFLDNQYEIRLDNLLQKKSSSIHHLESGIKNKIIQRKKILLEEILNHKH